MYSLISFDKCVHLCNYHLNKDSRNFPQVHVFSPTSPLRSNHYSGFYPQMRVNYCWALSKQNPTIRIPCGWLLSRSALFLSFTHVVYQEFALFHCCAEIVLKWTINVYQTFFIPSQWKEFHVLNFSSVHCDIVPCIQHRPTDSDIKYLLSLTHSQIHPSHPRPELWALMDGLSSPVLIIKAICSGLLSQRDAKSQLQGRASIS